MIHNILRSSILVPPCTLSPPQLLPPVQCLQGRVRTAADDPSENKLHSIATVTLGNGNEINVSDIFHIIHSIKNMIIVTTISLLKTIISSIY